ncbi:hypothetical protein OU995_21415 [Roseateles sp. SL47]|uniref:hypothetical protein n=1 Tax=Roseateles sp. SL47 TaxID=2995138 RepID=UPI00226F0073|nr:hypothetical protein [Roseateles sp. SL47]WAC72103.1 hypothetical protein OU995_21415 [Roseateles sp. SL47]
MVKGISKGMVLGGTSVWDDKDFDQFVVGKSVQEIERLLVEGRTFSFPASQIAENWVKQQKELAQERLEAQRLALDRRAVDAAEQSASASVVSAQAAKRSATWAFASAVIALGALALAAWPYLKERIE